jgi:hypothetical protein
MKPRAWWIAGLVALPSCKDAPGGATRDVVASAVSAVPAPSAASSIDTKGAVVAIPFPAENVVKAVNPRGEAPYSGRTGTLRGIVRVHGDAPPDLGIKVTPECPGEAAATHGKLFRVGQDGTVADVLVAVTGYNGFVPAAEEAKKLTVHGCALSKRTLALTYGQRLEVSNLDKLLSYMPYLDGAPSKAIMVAMPEGDAVRLYPQDVGHYMLRDQLPKPFLFADVFVLKYATFDVTGLDGQYEIKRIPVGKVKASAFLPAINRTVEKDVDITDGETTVDFTLEFAAKKAGAKPPQAKKP